MKTKKKKLVLFDIDGTLVNSSPKGVGQWKERIATVFRKVYEISVPFDMDAHEYNGKVDKQVFRLLSEKLGIPKDIFDDRFPQARDIYHEELQKIIASEDDAYLAFDDAKTFVSRLIETSHIEIGVITGNIERNAWAKLEKAGLHGFFSFGAFADDVEDRSELVLHALDKAKAHFNIVFDKSDVIVIGDTVHDIRAARSGGVRSIGVATGVSTTLDELANEGADLAVSSLMDERVFVMLGLIDTPTKTTNATKTTEVKKNI